MTDLSVSVVVPNLDGREHLPVLLDSLAAQTFSNRKVEIIVVDNGSSDGSLRLVEERYPGARIVENARNLGFATACNQGAQVAGGRYIAFLNNDLRLEPDWLDLMVSCLRETATDVVCAGSRILSWDGARIDFERAAMTFAGGGLQPGFGLPAGLAGESRTQEALFACGGAMLIERAVFRDAGGFDEDYFAFFEDVDLGWRLWLLGHRVVLCPRAVAYHRHHSTAARFQRHQLNMLRERNALYTIFKNYDNESLATVLPAALLLVAKRAAYASGIPHEELLVPERSSSGRQPPGRLGIARRLNRALVRVARRMPRGERLQSFRLISAFAYSRLVALDELIDHLPRLMEKRRAIQARRKRTDAEIAPLFGPETLDPAEPGENYALAHRAVIESLGVAELLRQLRSDGTG